MDYLERFMVKPNDKVDLDKIDASEKGSFESKDQAREETEAEVEKDAQTAVPDVCRGEALAADLFAGARRGRQGRDHQPRALGDEPPGLLGQRVQGADPGRGVPTTFLWRYHQAVPSRGHVAIFNRSHYEDVLVVRVHNLVPPNRSGRNATSRSTTSRRLLAENGTMILKFYLHIDPDEQLERFKDRIDDPTRHWKISDGDYAERPFWNDYTKAFEAALGKMQHQVRPLVHHSGQPQMVPQPGDLPRSSMPSLESLDHEIPRARGRHCGDQAQVPRDRLPGEQP